MVLEIPDRLEAAGRGVDGVVCLRQAEGRRPADARGAACDEDHLWTHGSPMLRQQAGRCEAGGRTITPAGPPSPIRGARPLAEVRSRSRACARWDPNFLLEPREPVRHATACQRPLDANWGREILSESTGRA